MRKSVNHENVENLRNYLINGYKLTGNYDHFHRLYEEALETKNIRTESIKGEIAEVFLEVKAMEFTDNNKGVLRFKNFFIPTKHGTTEIDLALFSKKKILLFESKSYTQGGMLTDKCTLVTTRGRKIDIFKQNHRHYEHLDSQFGAYRKPNVSKPYRLALFGFSKKTYIDKRDKVWKEKFPYITIEDVDDFLAETMLIGEDIWDIEKVFEELTALRGNQEYLRRAHMRMIENIQRSKKMTKEQREEYKDIHF